MKRKIAIIALALVVCTLAVTLVACSSDPIVGTWENAEGTVKWVFTKNGKATNHLSDGSTREYTWKYTTQYKNDFPYTIYNEQGAPVDAFSEPENNSIRPISSGVFYKQ